MTAVLVAGACLEPAALGATDSHPNALGGCVQELVDAAEAYQRAEITAREPHAFLLPGDAQVHAVTFGRADCRAFLGIGAMHVQDLELRVQRPDGRTLAVSGGPSATPHAFYCGQAGETVMVTLRVLDGQGEVAFVAFSRLLIDAETLSVLDRCPGVGKPRPPAVDVGPEPSARDIEQELAAVSGELSALGYGPPKLLARGELGNEQHETHALGLDPSQCYALVAIGSAEAHDIDLRVVPSTGAAQPAAADVTRKRTATAKLCPEASQPYVFDVAAFQNGGTYAVYAFALSEPSPRPTEITGNSRIAYAETVRRMQQRGFFPQAAGSGLVRPGESLSMPIELVSGRCYALAAVAAHGGVAGSVALTVLGAGFESLASDARNDRDPLVFVCPTESQHARAVVRSKDARGPVRYLWLSGQDAPPQQERRP